MYYPYFRGKQYELVTIREMAGVLKKAEFCPVIEPVRETLSGLKKALDAVVDEGGQAIVIVNPHLGDLSGGESKALTKFLDDHELEGIAAGILLTQSMTTDEAMNCYHIHNTHLPTFIHAGFSQARSLAQALGKPTKDRRHIFYNEQVCGKLYQKHFQGHYRILLRDGFQRMRNRDYPDVEHFSDLHVTFPEEGMDGFGDFLIVGDEFNETGGPAYAVAIHLTFVDHEQDDSMMIYHFVSDRQDTPKDPAGKFAEALAKMMRKLASGESQVLETQAVKEFRLLHKEGHFPGLGYIKKLSMNHHIETLADYFKKTSA
jgi:hypothetical protein